MHRCYNSSEQVTLPKSRFETMVMGMACSLIEHSFLVVFSMVGKIMLHSKYFYIVNVYS